MSAWVKNSIPGPSKSLKRKSLDDYAVCYKINKLLDSGAIIKTAFTKEIGVSARSLSGFLGEWFKKREMFGIPLPVGKKQKTSAATTAPKPKATAAPVTNRDISDIHLDGEETDSVPIYNSYDKIRRKINLYLKKRRGDQFRGGKGFSHGAKSLLYYGAYVFFEKIRIKEGKPKTKHRQDNEADYPGGIDRTYDTFGRIWVKREGLF
ncbi:hypothetical protein B0T21DRAFT_398881 [Apiosordaria backusii]|uniref:Uncharacterized protein n=1 Tax=Apiosordaria backusii TaxID=314023 RepID=A0AA40ERS7_9PEZI|nr:hypothetical protein B0T21DRAFT_398881 [Apiosordaria backusii]